MWARSAPERLAHRVTKTPEYIPFKSASADKNHKGELTCQRAADCGLEEWSRVWHGEDSDVGDDIVQRIVDIYKDTREGDMDELILPPITGYSILRAASKFRSGTGVGTDSLRPRLGRHRARGH